MKNTVALYIRMGVTLVIGLYTSRVVLSTLGVEDFGIYNIVGGIVSMFAFLNNSMSGATSRFLTIKLGRNDNEGLRETFSAALTIHLLIAILIFVLGETIGLWFLENKLQISSHSMGVARVVYQLSLFTAMTSIIQVPYVASIISHERMNVYAYIEIFNTILKLGIVYLLLVTDYNKLILYAILLFCASVLIASIYIFYGVRNFPECKWKFSSDKKIIYPMLTFSSWDLYGNLSYTAKTQGVNMLLNLFFGVVINAAYGVAMQVQNAVMSFSNSFLTASRPQIVKYYAVNDINQMQKLIINTAKFSFLLISLISFPVILECRYVLHLWLKEVPEYAVVFCQLNLISGLLTSMFTVLTFAIHATGRIKHLSFVSGTIYILVIPISYFFLKAGFSPIIPFIINIVLLLVAYLINLQLLHYLISGFSSYKFLNNVVFVCLLFTLFSCALPLSFHFLFEEGSKRFIIVSTTCVLSVICTGYYVILSKEMRHEVFSIVLRKIRRRG
jgi:O-antigen/teichoic acid export membrane protein